jgi:hypothetical protein
MTAIRNGVINVNFAANEDSGTTKKKTLALTVSKYGGMFSSGLLSARWEARNKDSMWQTPIHRS